MSLEKNNFTPDIEKRIAALNESIVSLEEQREEIEYSLNKEIQGLDPKTKKERIQEETKKIKKIEKTIRENIQERNNLQDEAKYASAKLKTKKKTREQKKEDKEPEKAEEVKQEDLHEMVDKFVAEYDLADKLPEEFEALTDPQKLFVIQNLKKRIVDMVKSGAETQYSEQLQKEVKGKTKKILHNASASLTKEFIIKTAEIEIFQELRNTEAGQKLITDDLELLTKSVKDQTIEYNSAENNFNIVYMDIKQLEPCTEEEKEAVLNFNEAANKFRAVPYEWGQKESPSLRRKTFRDSEKAYEQAKDEILHIKTKREEPEEKGNAMIEIHEMDSFLKLHQLLNTHPEFEKELNRIVENSDTFEQLNEESEGGKLGTGIKRRWGNRHEIAKTFSNLANTFTGKNWTNRSLAAMGYGAKMITKKALVASQMNALTGITAVAVGGVIGSVKGASKAVDTLNTRKRKARYGEKDKTKERAQMTDVTRLTRRFEELTSELEESFKEVDPNEKPEAKEQREKRLGLLLVSIEHAQGKIERGEVNFGDKKSELSNNFKFVNSLNKALVLKEVLAEKNNEEIKERIDSLVYSRAHEIKERVSKEQAKFIKKQMLRGALIGAGAATFGYLLRWAGEHWFGWGGHHAEPIVDKTPSVTEQSPQLGPVLQPIETPPPVDTNLHQAPIIDTNTVHQQEIIEKTKTIIDKITNENIPRTVIKPEVKGGIEIHGGGLSNGPQIEPKTNGIEIHGGGLSNGPQPAPAQNLPKIDTVPNTEGIKLHGGGLSHGPTPSADEVEKIPADQNIGHESSSHSNGEMGQGEKEYQAEAPEEVQKGSGNYEEPIKHESVSPHHDEPIKHVDTNKTERQYGEPKTIHKLDKGGDNYEEPVRHENIHPENQEPIKHELPRSAIDHPLKSDQHVDTEPHGQINNHKSPDNLDKTKGIELSNGTGKPVSNEAINTTIETTHNPYHLTPEMWQEVNKISKQNVERIFYENKNGWTDVMNNPIVKKGFIEYASPKNTGEALSNYLHKLYQVTGLKPKTETFFRTGETNKDYITRALQKAASIGLLDKVKL